MKLSIITIVALISATNALTQYEPYYQQTYLNPQDQLQVQYSNWISQPNHQPKDADSIKYVLNVNGLQSGINAPYFPNVQRYIQRNRHFTPRMDFLCTFCGLIVQKQKSIVPSYNKIQAMDKSYIPKEHSFYDVRENVYEKANPKVMIQQFNKQQLLRSNSNQINKKHNDLLKQLADAEVQKILKDTDHYSLYSMGGSNMR
ncbi:UNKNOWN [Stylonychia lemnae]|uniref:Uncharacterized protein n=1 Tax=Stylonychia lemnae TaxID=5949 RepID=A0A078A0Q8_STYLE|nr:UNKNOWN [Stylonychia lemnae]|eukprot:CDW75786.1 UNKNOWN [Stylonychia lemnae]